MSEIKTSGRARLARKSKLMPTRLEVTTIRSRSIKRKKSPRGRAHSEEQLRILNAWLHTQDNRSFVEVDQSKKESFDLLLTPHARNNTS